jgi:dihydroflavonol-4-reductase
VRVLVTGATGFLGTHLVRSLLEAGDEVVALCRAEEPELEDINVHVVLGDVLDAASVARAAEGCEGVYHAAGKVSRRREDAEELYAVHVEGTKNVVHGARAAGVRRVVVASTSGTVAVRETREPSNEDDEAPIGLIGRWPYYRAKLFAERMALAANDASFEVVSVNPSLLLGPGDERGSSTEDVRLFLERRIPMIPGGGLSFVDARDVAEGMRLAMARGRPGERYLLGACNWTLREFFQRLARVSHAGAPLVPLPRLPLPELARAGAEAASDFFRFLGQSMPLDPVGFEMAQYFWYVDCSRAENELGWRARDPMDTLAATVDDLLHRGVAYDGRGRTRFRLRREIPNSLT